MFNMKISKECIKSNKEILLEIISNDIEINVRVKTTD